MSSILYLYFKYFLPEVIVLVLKILLQSILPNTDTIYSISYYKSPDHTGDYCRRKLWHT